MIVRNLRLLNSQATAKLIGVSHTTLIKWHRANEGPPRRKIGRRYYYQEDAILQWLEAHFTDANVTQRKTYAAPPENSRSRQRFEQLSVTEAD